MKNIKILRQSARKGNARKAKVREFWNIIVIMIAPAIFQGIVLPSVALQQIRASLHRRNAEVCENTDPLMEMRSEEVEDIDESLWTSVSRLWTFNVFCSHITWQNYFFLLTINFRFDIFSSDNTLYFKTFQCNLYFTSYGWTNKSVILRTSSQIPTSAWVFS